MWDPSLLSDLVREGLALACVLALPLVGAALIAGLVSALLQSVAKVSDAALVFVPRLAAVAVAVVVAAPWIAERMRSFAISAWSLIHALDG